MDLVFLSPGKKRALSPIITRNLTRYGIIAAALVAGYIIFYTVPFLTTGLSLYTLFLVLLLLFYRNIERYSFRFLRSHIVICGPGHLVAPLVRNFIFSGARVVVIEKNITQEKIHEYSDMGARVYAGDPVHEETLRSVGIRNAAYLIAVTDDDGANAEIALRAHDIQKEDPGRPIGCFTHIVDPTLCNLLATSQHNIFDDRVIRLEFFNIYQTAAYLALRDFPPFPEDQVVPAELRVLVIGGGRMGSNVIREIAKRWRDSYGESGTTCTVTLIDHEAETITDALRVRYPALSRYCTLVPITMKLFSPEFFKGEFLDRAGGRAGFTSVYICLGDEYLGLSVALDIAGQMARGAPGSVPIVVRTRYSSGLASILDRYPGDAGNLAGIHAFPVIDRTCGPDLILGSSHEIIARAIHEEYLRSGQGKNGPAYRSWVDLPEEYREANRRQVDAIFEKLKRIRAEVVPYSDWNVPLFEFTPDELELLSLEEHERWMTELQKNGWCYGAERDDNAKQHPCLVSYDELPEQEKEKDRRAVMSIPRLLRSVDLGIIRMPQGG
jgi:hypothetical protein